MEVVVVLQVGMVPCGAQRVGVLARRRRGAARISPHDEHTPTAIPTIYVVVCPNAALAMSIA